MDHKRTYSKEQISKIIAKASKIQARKDLSGDEQGLTEEELIHIAEEVGIDRDSLFEAIQSSDLPELDSNFNWITASSAIQDIHIVGGEITDESWEGVVQDIRRATGGIGKLNKVGKSYEWEQRLKKIGYRHISVTPQNGNTKIQYVSNWRGLKIVSSYLSFIFGFTLTSISLIGVNLPPIVYALLQLLGGTGAMGVGRLYLKLYFEKQKSQFRQIIRSVSKTLNPAKEPEISIEERDSTPEKSSTGSSNIRRERS